MFTDKESLKEDMDLRGCIYNKEGVYCEVYIKNTIENIAAFIARGYAVPKLELVDTMDCLVLDTFGSFLNTIFDMDFRTELLEVLLPMQLGDDIPPVELSELDYEEMYSCSQEEYIEWVKDTTGYNLK